MSNEASKSKPFARPPKMRDILELSLTMRKEDQEEIWHVGRVTPKEALLGGWSTVGPLWTIEWDGKVVAMFGAGGVGPEGSVWLLASDDLPKIRKSFLRECRKYMDLMFKEYDCLRNMAWSKNEVHLTWLKWCGFTFEEPVTINGEEFIPFYKLKEN